MIAACLEASMNQMLGARTYRIMIPTIPIFGIRAHLLMMDTIILMEVSGNLKRP